MNSVIVKNTIKDIYFKVSLKDLSYTHTCTLQVLKENYITYCYSSQSPDHFIGDHLIVEDTNTTLYDYLTLNHPELFI